jgi:hypothetical protein
LHRLRSVSGHEELCGSFAPPRPCEPRLIGIAFLALAASKRGLDLAATSMRLAVRTVMARMRLISRPWLQTVVVALVALLLGAGASYVFDRDLDGVDDGGLDLNLPAAFQGFVLSFRGLLPVGWMLSHQGLLPGVCTRPRSPPSLHSASR